MIEVKKLTKKYGSHTAVSDLSFSIEKGRIYGFLGPNGAGKSTTMNILTGCLSPTEGEVLVDGHSISDDPLACRRLMGYLPEHPPLYTDMTPEEYLSFVASAKGVAREEREAQMEAVMARTGIGEVRKRLIRNLSKGFRQRVGIAQALLGSPEIIILDEPTVGLDPAQIIEIRDLIRELGKDHTIILSSHILSEVQAVCDSIMIISAGRLVASDTPENLTRLFAGTTTVRLEVSGSEERIRELLMNTDGVEDFTLRPAEDGTCHAEVRPEEDQDIRETLFRAFAGADLPLLEMTSVRASLEDVFMELTRSPGDTEENEKRGRKRKKNKTTEPADGKAEGAEEEERI